MRRRVARNPIEVLSGGVVHETTHGGRADRAVVRERFLPLPVDPLLELRWELDEDFAGDLPLDDRARETLAAGARVKPVVFVPEGKRELVDREAIREWLRGLGAKHVRAPIVHVVRRQTHRDERHRVDVPLEESLRIFAEETKPREATSKVEFAAALAREADAGEKE